MDAVVDPTERKRAQARERVRRHRENKRYSVTPESVTKPAENVTQDVTLDDEPFCVRLNIPEDFRPDLREQPSPKTDKPPPDPDRAVIFDWKDEDSLLVPHQSATQIYTNQHDQVVIAQADSHWCDRCNEWQDTAIALDRHHIRTLIKSLQFYLREEESGE